ncbi:Predicted small secreted protein [Limimonas halophila]|uniref:Predicted small secreted protein n=1 Tax=Limimonas halophila TaxID=1082479 RepID=A0A1G7TFX1_9PROT|nr:entericidin A/B family lipoprotein [Limimonas halophila]SDG34246.1 Predicted small secreted protein [Limimonas halophila]
MPRHVIALLAAIGLAAGAAGCNTVEGLGRDISSAGNAVTGAATDTAGGEPTETQQARQPKQDDEEPTELR